MRSHDATFFSSLKSGVVLAPDVGDTPMPFQMMHDSKTKENFTEYCLYRWEGNEWEPFAWFGEGGPHATTNNLKSTLKYLRDHGGPVLLDLIYYPKGAYDAGFETLARVLFRETDGVPRMVTGCVHDYPACRVPAGKCDTVLRTLASALLALRGAKVHLQDTPKGGLSDLPEGNLWDHKEPSEYYKVLNG